VAKHLNALLNIFRDRPIVSTTSFLFIIVLVWAFSSGEKTIPGKADFYPSPGSTSSGFYLNAAAINSSNRCGNSGCHPDIHAQWQLSA
ncbi:uncharacterized protein METZ01_LOCUS169365, partial [marine metagenome]